MSPTISGQIVVLRENFRSCYPPSMRKPMLLSEVVKDVAEVLCDDGEIRKIEIGHIIVED